MQLVAPITSLCFTQKGGLVLAGLGHTLHIYDAATGKLLLVEAVFPGGEAIHGIVTHTVGSDGVELLLLFGIREFRVHVLDVEGGALTPPLVPLFERRLARRVLAMGLAHGSSTAAAGTKALLLVVGSDDNALTLWSVGELAPGGHCELPETRLASRSAARPAQRIGCSHHSVLYSMALQQPRLEAEGAEGGGRMLVAAGSAFLNIVVWDGTPAADAQDAPVTRPPRFALVGHAGAFFCLNWSFSGRWLVSCSDDRRVLLWRVDAPPVVQSGVPTADPSALAAPLSPLTSWFAHSARVWQCCWVAEGEASAAVASAGEDGNAKLWSVRLDQSGQPARCVRRVGAVEWVRWNGWRLVGKEKW